MKFYLIFAFLCGFFQNLQAQSQITALPLKYNPANAGFTGGGRLSIYAATQPKSGRNEFQIATKSLHSTAFSYDHFIQKISTGIGFQTAYMGESIEPAEYDYGSFLNADYIPGYYNSSVNGYNFLAAISPKISFQGKYTLAPGFSIEYTNLTINTKFSQLYLYPEANYNLEKYKYTIGILLNTKNYFIGYSSQVYYKSKGKHNEVYYQFPYFLFQAGCVLKRSNKSKFVFTPTLLVRVRNFDIKGYKKFSLLINLNFKYKKIIWGVMPGIMVGYQGESITFQLNYSPVNFQYLYDPMERFSKQFELNIKYRIFKNHGLTSH
ncbi:MAG: hypothetical protein J7604_00780 [Sporocytophaga sp.]|uniref:hypothetical protein n=1 Tax=Sporocytophaga sp. TaxID=2231183 RepID=UPI001B1D74BA|nr:hypothetical protein [Sporocytophaga sp.]MBO9698705.1 hypothetical protein [Sporocytophaga sp.]